MSMISDATIQITPDHHMGRRDLLKQTGAGMAALTVGPLVTIANAGGCSVEIYGLETLFSCNYSVMKHLAAGGPVSDTFESQRRATVMKRVWAYNVAFLQEVWRQKLREEWIRPRQSAIFM